MLFCQLPGAVGASPKTLTGSLMWEKRPRRVIARRGGMRGCRGNVLAASFLTDPAKIALGLPGTFAGRIEVHSCGDCLWFRLLAQQSHPPAQIFANGGRLEAPLFQADGLLKALPFMFGPHGGDIDATCR